MNICICTVHNYIFMYAFYVFLISYTVYTCVCVCVHIIKLILKLNYFRGKIYIHKILWLCKD